MNGHILLKAFCFERVIIKYIKCACFCTLLTLIQSES